MSIESSAAPLALFDENFGSHAATVERLADVLAATAAARDRSGGSALTERRLLRESGLLTLAVPREYDGQGESWALILRIVRRLAAADSSLAHLFGFQHLQVASVLLFGSPAQQGRYLGATVREGWFWGNAVNSRDTRLTATRVHDDKGSGWLLDGVKSFCSGAKDSDVLNVSIATGSAPTERLYLVVPTTRDGIRVNDDWDNMGQRQTDSGTVSFDHVRVHDDEVLGPPGAAATPRATLRNILAQTILTEIYLGNAIGALREAVTYTRERARPWAMANAERAVDDALLQLRGGELWANLQAATALTERANAAFDLAWLRGNALQAEERAQVSLLVAAARSTAARTALDVTSQIFELMGASATAARHGFDRYWRNVRVHTLHDPLDYRRKEIGRWLLADELPNPYAYG